MNAMRDRAMRSNVILGLLIAVYLGITSLAVASIHSERYVDFAASTLGFSR
jgi:hypothetical protein